MTLAYRLRITLFKLRYNLPYRALEAITGVDHVTLSRTTNKLIQRLGALGLSVRPYRKSDSAFVNTTTIRIGRSSVKQDYTGYKHLKGVKFQCVAMSDTSILSVSPGYSASIHDKKVFEREYPTLAEGVKKMRLSETKPMLGWRCWVCRHQRSVAPSYTRATL